MGELAFGGREDKNLEGRASIGGIFPGGENKQTFGWWEEPPPPSFPVGKPIYIYIYIYICIYDSASLRTGPPNETQLSNFFSLPRY